MRADQSRVHWRASELTVFLRIMLTREVSLVTYIRAS
jgi:hypothetical protein